MQEALLHLPPLPNVPLRLTNSANPLLNPECPIPLQIVITQLSSKFREAARLVAAPLPPPAQLPAALPAGALLVRRVYAGVNASDVNYSSGR